MSKSKYGITIRMGADERSIEIAGVGKTDLSVVDQLPVKMRKREMDRASSAVIGHLSRKGFFAKKEIV